MTGKNMILVKHMSQ